jgi:hypothetical protein
MITAQLATNRAGTIGMLSLSWRGYFTFYLREILEIAFSE